MMQSSKSQLDSKSRTSNHEISPSGRENSRLPSLKQIKQEVKQETEAEYVEKVITWTVNQETLYEKDPLAVNTDQVNERVTKDELKEDFEDQKHKFAIKNVIKAKIKEELKEENEISIQNVVKNEDDPLAFKTEELIIEQEEGDAHDSLSEVEEPMEEDSSDASESTTNRLVFSCEKCDVTLTSSLRLKNHKKFCRGPRKPAVIVKPEAVTTDVQTLAKSVDGKKMYFCKLCNYQTIRSWDMKRHLVTHTGAKPFKCEVCDKTFTQASSFSRHKLIHTQDKPHKCSECSYACNQSSHLKTHMTIHTGDKWFACKLCRYQTAVRSSLTVHMSTHTDEKPFRCTQCEYKTIHSSHLQIHIRAKHTTEKPYTCTHCDYKTAQSSALKRHTQRKHTNDKPFSCAHCEYKTALKYELRGHLKRKHLDQSD